MNEVKEFQIGKCRIELIVPYKNKDLKHSIENNINAYDEDGLLLWNISELLKTYSDKNGLRYDKDMYFDIRILDNENIFCIGFINHCEIDLKSKKIIRLANNK